MSAPRIFVADPLPHAPTGPRLRAARGRRAARRAGAAAAASGDALTLFDGTGGEFAATITRIDKRGVGASLGALRSGRARIAAPGDAGAGGDRQRPDGLGGAQGGGARRRRGAAGAGGAQPGLGARRARPSGASRTGAASPIAACEQCGRNRVPEVLAPRDACRLAGRATTPRRTPRSRPVLMLAPGAARTLAVAVRGRRAVRRDRRPRRRLHRRRAGAGASGAVSSGSGWGRGCCAPRPRRSRRWRSSARSAPGAG